MKILPRRKAIAFSSYYLQCACKMETTITWTNHGVCVVIRAINVSESNWITNLWVVLNDMSLYCSLNKTEIKAKILQHVWMYSTGLLILQYFGSKKHVLTSLNVRTKAQSQLCWIEHPNKCMLQQVFTCSKSTTEIP